jgi:hypothetical protein
MGSPGLEIKGSPNLLGFPGSGEDLWHFRNIDTITSPVAGLVAVNREGLERPSTTLTGRSDEEFFADGAFFVATVSCCVVLTISKLLKSWCHQQGRRSYYSKFLNQFS